MEEQKTEINCHVWTNFYLLLVILPEFEMNVEKEAKYALTLTNHTIFDYIMGDK